MGPVLFTAGKAVAQRAAEQHNVALEQEQIVDEAIQTMPPAEQLQALAIREQGKTRRRAMAFAGVLAVSGAVALGPSLLFDKAFDKGKAVIDSIFNAAPKQQGIAQLNHELSGISFPEDLPLIDAAGTTGAQFELSAHVSKLSLPLSSTTVETSLDTVAHLSLSRDAISLGVVDTKPSQAGEAADANWNLLITVSNKVAGEQSDPHQSVPAHNAFDYQADVDKVTELSHRNQFLKRYAHVLTGDDSGQSTAEIINYAQASWGNACAPALEPLIPSAIAHQVRNQLLTQQVLLAAIKQPAARETVAKLLDRPIQVRIVDQYGQPTAVDSITLPQATVATKDELANKLGVAKNELKINGDNDCTLTQAATREMLALQHSATTVDSSTVNIATAQIGAGR
ncbi:MAG: hypothetical protein ABIV43_00195 [Candidatus Saccharimonadales bacterium]